MNTFKIKSWFLGRERQIIITEPASLDGTDFELHLEEQSRIIVRYDNGKWHSIVPDETSMIPMPPQLEIDSIGFLIAQYWCERLEKQLENFQLSI